MITLSKQNLTEYLKSQIDFLDYSKPLIISEVGEGSVEEDGDGFINFVFRVSDGTLNLIVKQCRESSRMIADFVLPVVKPRLSNNLSELTEPAAAAVRP